MPVHTEPDVPEGKLASHHVATLDDDGVLGAVKPEMKYFFATFAEKVDSLENAAWNKVGIYSDPSKPYLDWVSGE